MNVIINFDDFQLNESVQEAKQFLTKMIRQGYYSDVELTDPESPYNVIKKYLEKNPGYTGFFVKQYYGDPERSMPLKMYMDNHVVPLYDKLLRAKKYNAAVDLNKFVNLIQLRDHLDQVLASREIPGLVLDEPPIFKPIHGFLKKSDYKFVLCVKKQGNDWVRSPETIMWWGSPKWCIKSRDTFMSSYVTSDDHLQYVIIHKSMFETIKNAAIQGLNIQNPQDKFVPRNYEHVRADEIAEYTPINPNTHRIGSTTKPLNAANRDPFELLTSNTDFNKQNDANSNVSTTSFISLFEPLNFYILDIAARDILGLEKSQFDTVDITLDDFINYLKIDFTPRSVDEYNKQLHKIYQMMNRHSEKRVFQENILPSIPEYILNNPETFDMLHPMLFFVEDIPEPLINMFEKHYNTDNNQNLNKMKVINIFQMYLEAKKNNKLKNEKIDEIANNFIGKEYMVDNLLISKVNDNIMKNVDLKTYLLTVYENDRANSEYSSIDNPITFNKILQLAVDYLFIHQNEFGKQIISDNKWDIEKWFAKTVIEQDEIKNSEALSKTAKSLIDKHLELIDFNTRDEGGNSTLSPEEIKEEFLAKIEGEDQQAKYNVMRHNKSVLYALQKYINEYDSELKKYLES